VKIKRICFKGYTSDRDFVKATFYTSIKVIASIYLGFREKLVMEIKNKNIMITGANSGIGRVNAIEFAKLGANLYLAGRSSERHAALLQELQTINPSGHFTFIPLDLGDLDSVRTCAKTFLEMQIPLHMLINNAGIYGLKGSTKQGFEMHFGVNYLGPFLLTNLLLDQLKASAPARIINVASRAHYRVKAWDWDALQMPTKGFITMQQYSVSKLANILFTNALVAVLKGSDVLTFSLHPGVVRTGIWRNLPGPLQSIKFLPGLITPEEGAKTTMLCALEALPTDQGKYFSQTQLRSTSALAQDTKLSQELWNKSLKWVGLA
jgi:retinol dehydrogenase 12